MNSTKVLLGRKIKQLRKEKGWTQDYLSELLGINTKSVLRIENGKTFPTIENLEKIASAFDLEIYDLFKNKALADKEILKGAIYDIINELNEYKIRILYKFLYSIRWYFWYKIPL